MSITINLDSLLLDFVCYPLHFEDRYQCILKLLEDSYAYRFEIDKEKANVRIGEWRILHCIQCLAPTIIVSEISFFVIEICCLAPINTVFALSLLIHLAKYSVQEFSPCTTCLLLLFFFFFFFLVMQHFLLVLLFFFLLQLKEFSP